MTTLEKIRAEIDVIEINGQVDEHTAFIRTGEHVKQMALDIIDKYAEQEPTDEWQNGYDMAWEEAKVFYEQEPCDDVVSRQAIMKLKRHNLVEGQFVSLYDIERLPSVRPQEQTKEEHIDVFEVANTPWIFLDNCANSGYYCSKCKKKLVKDGYSETVNKINFCPNCGAKMESEEQA